MRTDDFAIVDGHLVRNAAPDYGGDPYRHRCLRPTFEQVAHAIEEAGTAGFILAEVAGSERLPWSQVATAVAFLKERGCVVTRYKRNYPATESCHLDAMIEFCALEEEATS